jgi:hypothetical protein
LLRLRVLQSVMNLDLFYDWPPLVPSLWLSSSISNSRCLQIFFLCP